MAKSSDSGRRTARVDMALGMSEDFRDYLKSRPVAAREADEKLLGVLRESGFRMNRHDLRAVIGPWIMRDKEVKELTRDVRAMSKILERIIKLAMSSSAFMEQLGVPASVEELALLDTQSRLAIEFGRYDFIPTPEGPRFIEFNVDSAAGAVFCSTLNREFQATEAAKAVGMNKLLGSATEVSLIVDALLAAWKESTRHSVVPPRIAIVDFDDIPTRPEQAIIRDECIRREIPCELIDPREFKYDRKQKALVANGEVWNLIYRRAMVTEMARRKVLVAEMLEGIKDGVALVINPFRSRVAGNKDVLEILTSDEYASYFSEPEHVLLARAVPWTRRLRERTTDYRGREVDLVDFIATRPEKFVLKPGTAYGGEAVVLGPFCKKLEWQKAVDRFLGNGGVVQEYVTAKTKTVPILEGATYAEVDKYMTMGACVVRGEYAGSIARVSDDPVVNVGNGGGVIPVLELGGRSKYSPIETARKKRRRRTGPTA